MGFIESGPAIALWAAALVSAVTAAAAWRLRARSAGGAQFAAMMIGIVNWCLMEGMEAAALGVDTKVLFSKLGYIGTCSVAPLFVSFALAYHGERGSFGPLRMLLIWTIPVATLLLAGTNEWHHLVWTSFSPAGRNLVLYGHGPWYWVWVAYAAMATCGATAVLLQSVPGCIPLSGDRHLSSSSGLPCRGLGPRSTSLRRTLFPAWTSRRSGSRLPEACSSWACRDFGSSTSCR